MDFYLTQNGIRKGPFRVFQIKEMVDRGEANTADLGWHDGLDGWRPLTDIPAIAPYLPGGKPTTVTADDQPMPVNAAPGGATTGPAWGGPPPLPLPDDARPPSGEAGETKWHLFGMRALPRFLARSLDSMLWFALVCGLGSATGLLPANTYAFPLYISFWIVPIASLAWVFVEAWLLSRFGMTLGKWIFNVRVRHLNGGLPTYLSALKRGFFIWVFAWGLGHFEWAMIGSVISLLMFLQNGRMVWDYLVSTQIVYGRPHPAGWIVFAVVLGISIAVKILLALGQPLPANMPSNQREIIQQAKADLRKQYPQWAAPTPATPAAPPTAAPTPPAVQPAAPSAPAEPTSPTP